MATTHSPRKLDVDNEDIQRVTSMAETTSSDLDRERLKQQTDTTLVTDERKPKRAVAQLGRKDILGAMDATTFVQPDLPNTRETSILPGTSTSLGGKLGQMTSVQQRDARYKSPENPLAPETMRVRVEKIMKEYEGRFGGRHTAKTNSAMLLAIAIQGAARVIADELYDPALEFTIAAHLAELYRSELRAALPADKDGTPTNRRAALELATVLVSDDPVSRFMHGEMRLDDAAQRIRQMAQAANVTAKKMYGLLREKWESELASYTLEDVQSREHKLGKAYSTREAPGELSQRYLQSLFGDDFTTGTPPQHSDTDRRLRFSDDATDKLRELETQIENTDAPSLTKGAQVDGVNLTGKQVAHLREVASRDKAILDDRIAQCIDVLTNRGVGGHKLSRSEATTVIKKLRAGLPNLPLTITVKGYQWFGKGKSVEGFDRVFRAGSSRTNQASLSALVGKPKHKQKQNTSLSYLGAWTGSPDRGEEYLRFRTWKDQLMTGNRGFSDAELPVFGALNANFANTGGTGGVPQDVENAYKDETRTRPSETDNQGTGINYYGDVHFALDRARVGNRLVYTATDHGTPHTDPFLMFADCLVGDGKNYKASLTGVEVNPIKNERRAAMLINAALGGNTPVRDELPFEIQIFGGVDLRRDVSAIHVSGNIPPLVAQRLMALQDTLQNIPVRVIAPMAPDTVYANTRELYDQVHQLMKERAKK